VPLPDPELEKLVAEEAARLGVVRRTPSEQEILHRCLLPLVNEGAKILAEGIALGAADIDVIYCNGYGFPRYRGGPMFWADSLGLGKVVALLEQFSAELGPEYWTPAPLLAQLAAGGETFASQRRG
jgi:3-hydroxyacyl-CoA dehydrogenase